VITLRGYQLDIATQLPTSMKNTNIRGLLGNYNDIASDDLISRDGQSIDANSTEERIYYDFGETCKSFIISCDLKVLGQAGVQPRFGSQHRGAYAPRPAKGRLVLGAGGGCPLPL